MSSSSIVAGGCDPTPPALNGDSDLSGALGAVGGLAQAAMSGNLSAALKGMAIEQGKQLATAALMKVFTVKPAPKSAKPPWPAMGKVAAPGSAIAAAATAAYNSVHTAPPAPAASAPSGGGAAPPVAGGGPGSAAGTGDKDGLGAIFGNNNGEGTPGVVGVAFSLANGLFSVLDLGDLNQAFEDGQERHDQKTGIDVATGQPIPDDKSNALSSAAQTIGQILGILARNIRLGDPFYQLVTRVMGPMNGYGFVTGVWQGTHQGSL